MNGTPFIFLMKTISFLIICAYIIDYLSIVSQNVDKTQSLCYNKDVKLTVTERNLYYGYSKSS